MLRNAATACLAAMALAGACASAASATTIKIYGSTSVPDSTLLAGLIAPSYPSATGNSINYVSQGTGPSLDSAWVAANHADVVIANAPPLEAAFVASGGSVEALGRAIFYNGFSLVGPTTDPAHVISSSHTHDTISALQDIAASGATGNSIFNSRDDASGTNVQEQVAWGLTSGVTKQLAWNAPVGDTTRYTPWDGTNTHPPHNFPTWYVPTHQQQGANLTTTNNCSPSTCYTAVDTGTLASVSHPKLQIVNVDNTSGSAGGAGLMTDAFHAYAVSVSPSHPTDALGFLDFLTSQPFQRTSLPGFPSGGVVVATGDAFASLTADTLAAQTTNAGGIVAFSTTSMSSAGTECWRLSMATFDDFDFGVASRLSPNTNDKLGPSHNGCVTVT